MSSDRLQELLSRQIKKWLWLLTRGSNYSALTGKNLVFWIGGLLWQVVAYERWWHMEVQLYMVSRHVEQYL